MPDPSAVHLTSRRIDAIRPSPSMASMAEVARLKEAGREVLSLNIGEPDFAPPAAAIEAAIQALRDGNTKYGPAQGLATLRTAIRDKLARDNGLNHRSEDILVASGAKQIIFAAAGATLDPGDEVIVPAPYWVSYPDIVTVFEGKPVVVPCQASAGFKLTPDQLATHLTARTRWLFLNSPGNPSGAVYSAEELAALGAVLAEHPRVLVMSDEIYEPFTYGAHRFVSTGRACPALVPRLLTVNGFSKGYAMTGLRLGYGAGPRWLIDACTKLITQVNGIELVKPVAVYSILAITFFILCFRFTSAARWLEARVTAQRTEQLA